MIFFGVGGIRVLLWGVLKVAVSDLSEGERSFGLGALTPAGVLPSPWGRGSLRDRLPLATPPPGPPQPVLWTPPPRPLLSDAHSRRPSPELRELAGTPLTHEPLCSEPPDGKGPPPRPSPLLLLLTL